jgi:hypothetical protein
MKKGKLIIGTLALFTAATTAIAFKASHPPQIDLYYFNSDSTCVAAPCETINHTNKACLVTVYTDSNCRSEYKGTIWIKNDDQ